MIELNGVVVRRRNFTDDLIELRIRPDKGVPSFLPGQYVAIGLPGSARRPVHFPAEVEIPDPNKLIKRAYSIGSSPTETDYLELYVAIVPTGALTSRLACIEEGDRIFIGPKITGTFSIAAVPSESNVVMLATGTGLAPFLSMVRTPNLWQGTRSIVVVHGTRLHQDLAYREDLETLERVYPQRFRYLPLVSREPSDGKTISGRIQKVFEDRHIILDANTDHAMLCGNPQMIDDIVTLLGPQGFTEHSRKSPGNLHFEKYW
jgi:ferredoxin/flavodoxin---NADP+ reductase